MNDDIDTCGLPKISDAPRFIDPNNHAAIEAERDRWYAAKNDKGHLFAIKNPAAWAETQGEKNQTYRVRPVPVSIGEALSQTRSGYRGDWFDRSGL